MGYIPPASKGTLSVAPSTQAPAAAPNTSWWDATTGKLQRWDTDLNEWVPVGEPSPYVAYKGLLLGRAAGSGTQGIAIGDQARSSSTSAVAIGRAATASGYASLSIGDATDASGPQAVAVGFNAQATGSYGAAFGMNSKAQGVSSFATTGATAGGYNDVAVGWDAKTDDGTSYQVAIGYGADVNAAGGIAIGQGANVGKNGAAGAGSVALGESASARHVLSVAIGSGATAGSPDHANAIAVGLAANAAHGNSIALGVNAQTTAREQAHLAVDTLRVGVFNGPPRRSAIVLVAPDGAEWSITVSNAGALTAAPYVPAT